jgi:Na+(H+)/acetate symporter ActP
MLFPFYIKVLSFNLGISFTVVFMVFVASFAGGQSVSFSDVTSALLLQLAIQFGIVTLIFTMLDKHLTKYPDRSDPRKPQQLKHPGFLEADVSKAALQVSRLESFSRFIASAVFLVWLRAAHSRRS